MILIHPEIDNKILLIVLLGSLGDVVMVGAVEVDVVVVVELSATNSNKL